MKNNIFYKMILIFLIPVFGMIFYSSLYLYEKYKMLNELSDTNIGISYVLKAEKLLNNIQKERGLSVTYISSESKLFHEKLRKQKTKTDKIIKEYLNFITSTKFSSKEVKESIKRIQENLYLINTFRNKVLHLSITNKKHINNYNNITKEIISSMNKILLKDRKTMMNKKLYSILTIIKAKEYAALERAMLANAFSKKSKTSLTLYNEVSKNILLQNKNIKEFKASIDIEVLNFYNKSVNNSINKKVEIFRNDFSDAYVNEKVLFKAKQWWSASTLRINAIGRTVEYFVTSVLINTKSKTHEIYLNFIYTGIYFILGVVSLFILFFYFRRLTIKEQENFYNLNKLKQVYNILSHTNELIIYDYKMNEVLKQVTTLVSKELDLSLSFVAMMKEDGLKVVEFSKKDNVNIENLNVNKNNSIYKKVFFEKQHIIRDNILEDNSSLDLSVEIKNAIKSIAVYPLFKNDNIVGVLSFCTSRINYFDKQIIEILEKMSNDLSFGLYKQEKEELRIKYEDELRIAAYAFDSQEAMAITDLDAKIIKVNNAFTKITGYSQEEVLGKNPNVLKSGKHDKHFYEIMWKKLLKDGLWSGELYNKRKNGEVYPEKTTITSIKDDEGETTHYIAQFFDITELKKHEENLLYEVQHDTLTGLYNRIVLEDRLKLSVIASNRHKNFGAVLFLDLDNFKYINDSLGHNIGDKLLIKIAEVLLKISREDDLIVRLGGDEFIILVHNLGLDRQKALLDIEKYAKKINKILNQSLQVDSYELTVTTSIGISIFPEFDKDSEEIMKNADTAMYMAKKQGKNTIAFYHNEFDINSKDNLQIENDLRKALKNNEFELYYQTKYNKEAEKIIGYEALIRWNHPIKGLLYPDSFIPIAEQSSLIIDIGKWVFEDCCLQINSWIEDKVDLNSIKISINISSLELEQVDFIDRVKETLKRVKTPAKYLELEITETSMFKNIDLGIMKLHELKKLGISTSIDDFGVGFSSLNYISKLPVNSIKLDKSFIMNKELTVNDAIIDMVIDICKKLNIDLIVEGVETLEDIEYLEQKNTFIYQGFYFSKPVKNKEAISLLSK